MAEDTEPLEELQREQDAMKAKARVTLAEHGYSPSWIASLDHRATLNRWLLELYYGR